MSTTKRRAGDSSSSDAGVKKHKATAEDAKDCVEALANEWDLKASDISIRTINPIRAIVDRLKIPDNKDKPLIPLSIGDPTAFGNLDPPDHLTNTLVANLQSKGFNGYAPSTGIAAVRQAIAERYGCPEAPLAKEDIIITSGCSGALVIAIQGLAGTGDNILCPMPGFCLYETAAGHSGVKSKFYKLDPDKQWEVDLEHLESQMDERTKAIVINNPSNPCGANYSKEHLEDILKLAERKKVAILADEIYGDMVFKTGKSHRIASLTTEVPVVACGGIAKQYLIPGWRVGWLMIHDRHNRLKKVREGLLRLSQLILGASTIAQSVVPNLLNNTPKSYYVNLMAQLEDQANALVKNLIDEPCLQIIQPQGAMYVMARVCTEKLRDIEDDRDFAQKLLNEEMVFVLPGACFKAPGFVRFVFCAPKNVLHEAAERIKMFCKRHAK